MKITTSIKAAMSALTLLAAVAIHDAGAQESVTTTNVSTTNTAGTISGLNANSITVTTEKSASPISYQFSEETTFVDETGAVVSRETMQSGVPVTVYYSGIEQPTVSKVVVRKAVAAPAVIEQEKTTTTTTTTTTSEE